MLLPEQTNAVELVVNDGGRPAPDYRVVVDRPHLLRRQGRFFPLYYAFGQVLLAEHNISHWAAALREEEMSPRFLHNAIRFEMKTHHPRQEPWDSMATGIMWAYDGSPFVACSIAAWMGCERIGVIGVDMAKDSLKLRKDVDFQYGRLRRMLSADLVTLQEDGPLESLPHEDLEMFATMAP